jgi:uncharacterized membrane protein
MGVARTDPIYETAKQGNIAMLANDPVLNHLPVLTLHITGGSIGILAGWSAVLVAKGERLHRLFGKVFVVGMALMAIGAIYLGSVLTALEPMEQANIGMGLVVLYLISTSWMTVGRRQGTTGAFEKFALAMGIVISATFLFWSVRALAPGGYDGYGPELYFAVGGIMALFAAFDAKMILRGGVSGSARIARHLLRMCAAWLIACISFFEGQQKVMPAWMHGSKVLLVLAFAPFGFMLFWYIRIRIVSRFKRTTVAI